MHRALLIPEVLLEIFAHLNIWDPSSNGKNLFKLARKSLAAFARTCKAFHEPAMDLLWAKLEYEEQLNPLLGCVTRLHPLIYYSGPTRDESTWPKSIEPLSAHEACQFLRHSHRVRSLWISSDRFFHLLSVIPAETCVFPRLRSLTWWLSTGKKYLDLFLSNTLRRCYLSVNEDLKYIVSRCAALEDLTIEGSDVTKADELCVLSDSVRLCKRLVTLSCPPLDWAAWNHLSSLSSLLKVNIIEDRIAPGPWPLEQDTINFSPFLNVTALCFLLQNVTCMITVMQYSQFPSLKEFEINLDVMSAAEATQLFRALSHCKACQTLESINIFSYSSRESPGGSLMAIPHLLCFTQLRNLQLNCQDYFIYLDNDLLLEAMSTWPHICNLQIENSYLHPSVTFRGLFAALRLCPRLHTLRIAVDVVNIDIDPNDEQIQHTSLRTLDLETAESPIPNAEALARIIFTWLPCVRNISQLKDDWELWNEVNNHLNFLHHDITGAASNT
ncbi:hypothetical protein EDB19DRAFT_1904624 [Suillus lakei]|nr:hypothetical protein EDB19DRAFT_1904624 [Suillus lakei]